MSFFGDKNLSVQQRLERALRDNDHATIYEISRKRLQKNPSDQLSIKLLLFGSKHDNKTFPRLLKYKDLIKFPDKIQAEIDYEALLMLLDIIHACDSLANALSYTAQYIDRLSPQNAYYNELLFSTMGVKFADFAEPSLSLKYHMRALSEPGSSFLSQYNYGHSLIAFGKFEEAINPYKSRWAWPQFPSIERKFSFPELPLDRLTELVSTTKIFVWSEQGIGDQLLWCTSVLLLQKMGFSNITFEVHSKLRGLMKDSFPGIQLLEQPYTVEGFDSQDDPNFSADSYDYHISCADLFLKLQKSFEEAQSLPKVLKFQNTYGLKFRQTIQEDQPDKVLIGIHWSSGIIDPVRQRTYLTEDDLTTLSQLNDRVVFVSFNYALTVEEVADVRSRTGLNLVGIQGIDQRNDLYSATSLMVGMDLFLGVYSSPTIQAALAGIPTVSFAVSENPERANPKLSVAPNHRCMIGTVGFKRDMLEDIVKNFGNVLTWASQVRL